MTGFALLDARTRTDVLTNTSQSGRNGLSIPAVSIQVPPRSGSEIGLSVLIGSNGTGKTRLLSSIADAFLQLDRAKEANKPWPIRKFPLSELTYAIGQNVYQITSYGRSKIKITRNNHPCQIAEVELPRRVVALTVAPHDRFPLGKARPSGHSSIDKVYRYMGLRDRTGRASMLAFLYSALESLLEDSGHIEGRRDRIATVFKLLKYQPKMEITYSLRMSRKLVAEAMGSDRFIQNLPTFQQRRVREIIDGFSGGYADFSNALAVVLERLGEERKVTVPANITEHHHDEIMQFQMLRKAGVLSVRAIEVERLDGVFVDLKDASSGELSIAASFLALAGVLEDSSLVLIDEPEISLHPEWQSTYIETLTSTFRGYQGCHYLIATHSPLIVSDIPQHATVYSLDRNADIDGEDVAGGSTDRLLVQLFKTPAVSNLYLKEEIVSALRLAADGDADTMQFEAAVIDLIRIGADIDDDEPVKEVINALAETLQASR